MLLIGTWHYASCVRHATDADRLRPRFGAQFWCRKRILRMADKRPISSPRRKTVVRSRAGAAALRKPREAGVKAEAPTTAPKPPWMAIPEPRTRALKVYALDPSAGQYVGNVMTVRIRWERNLRPGPIGRRFAVIDYDAANHCYYPRVGSSTTRACSPKADSTLPNPTRVSISRWSMPSRLKPSRSSSQHSAGPFIGDAPNDRLGDEYPGFQQRARGRRGHLGTEAVPA